MDISSWDGTLLQHDFYIAACSFAEEWGRSKPVFPPWIWVPCAKRLGLASHQADGYLTLEKLCIHGSSDIPSQEEIYEEIHTEEESGPFVEEPVDNATLVESSSREVNFFDFHIVYSATYRVPVLYFRAYSIDGKPLVLDELKGLPACSEKLLLESKWTFITQEPKIFSLNWKAEVKNYLMYANPYGGTSTLEQTMVQATSMWDQRVDEAALQQ
ncbi:hypothetical protein FNV43_RR22036 [Rhamnella rubrinervis]|uniref:Ubiquitin-like-conjugating enzyme ATG10 n=1 Tax=Rhamnella rubrinervis TaxID=2594499 RepID=A0A8K0GQP6_9ROSA|nr:hypothetical protein FNV43_RR22036 [Rhamnella rubrinervis]